MARGGWFLLIDFINQETPETGDSDSVNFALLSDKIDRSLSHIVIASKALQSSSTARMDCFALLAMTGLRDRPKQSPFPAVPWGKGYCHAATNCRHFGRGFRD
jgi:hypothetical protein